MDASPPPAVAPPGPSSENWLAHRLRTASTVAGSLVFLLGTVVLAGWAAGSAALKSLSPDWATMKANTAACFVLAGAALVLLCLHGSRPAARRASQAAAAIAALVGLLTIVEYLGGWSFGIDTLLFDEPAGAVGSSSPGRMSEATAVGFLLTGVALVLLSMASPVRRAAAQLIVLAPLIVALIAVTGYLYDARSLYGVAFYSSVAIHTALGFLVLGCGILFARPDRGWMRAIIAPQPGAVVLRWLIPAAIAVPIALGWLRLAGERKGLYTTEFGLAIMVLASSAALVTLAWWIARLLDAADAERRLAEERHDRLREQLARARKLEAIGQLAGGVAHDYNNMLSVIIGNTELALAGSPPGEPLRSELEEILLAATRSAEITRQLLAFARRQPAAPRVLDLSETIEGTLTMLRRLIGEDIELVWRAGQDVWPVRIDPAQVDQILTNLCVNARDAITGSGSISIETANVALDEAYCEEHAGFAPGDFVLLTISDTGSGMDSETLESVFEPFFTTKGPGAGTGLGLATVYGIVKQNGGFINVYSEPGAGTTMKLYLPRYAGDESSSDPRPAPALPGGQGETVLVVEDEPAILTMAAAMLERLGYTVLAAVAPGDVAALLESLPDRVDLLVTDVVMPGVNGRELAERLRVRYPELRTLFMSGYPADVVARRGILDDDVRFIQKPFSIHDLAVKVRAVLEE